MKLSDLTVTMRPRNEWEAIDVGFALVQNNWHTIYWPFFLLLLLIYSILWLVTPIDYIWVASLIAWWLKPLYDRFILNILSHSLFGQQLTSAQAFSALPHLIRRTGLLSRLTFRRFSLSRSYNLPIWQLEGLRGEARKNRQQLLYLQGHDKAVWLTLGCAHFELITVFTIWGFIAALDPTGYIVDFFKDFIKGHTSLETNYWSALFNHISYGLSIWIIHPFYIAGGFGLYLNRRSQLEAWDLEIAFRKLGMRLRDTAKPILSTVTPVMIAMLLLISASFITKPVYAVEIEAPSNNEEKIPSPEPLSSERAPVKQAKEKMDEVMALPEFADKVTYWKLQPKDPDKKNQPNTYKTPESLEAFSKLIAQGLKAAVYVAIVILLILGFIYREKIITLLNFTKKPKKSITQPDVLFGLDIRPESLPEDIASAARNLWEQGKAREALSLLYRATLMILTRHDSLDILNSHTEGDILSLARQYLSDTRVRYLNTLTQQWQTIAYAHRQPDQHHVQKLFQDWPEFEKSPSKLELSA